MNRISRNIRPVKPALPASRVAALVNLEYSFIRVGSDLMDIARELKELAPDLPDCALTYRQVKKLRRLLAAILEPLDGHITAAVEQRELLDSPPF